jgi:DNA polymerase-2
MNSEINSSEIFILTGDWFDYKEKNILQLIGCTNNNETIEVLIPNKPVFFIERENTTRCLNIPFKRKKVNLKTFDGKPVDALYFNTQKDSLLAAKTLEENSIATYESDVDPLKRYLMEKLINTQVKATGKSSYRNGLISYLNPLVEPCELTPEFSVLSIDIETGSKGNRLYSIAGHFWNKNKEDKKVFMCGEKRGGGTLSFLEFFENEKLLLQAFLNWFKEKNPDLIIGWHVIGFDLMFLENKYREHYIPFEIARSRGRVVLKKTRQSGYFASITGRVVIDGPQALRSSFFLLEDYRLESVAMEILGKGKTITSEMDKAAEIDRLFENDKTSLAKYNLNDTELVSEIFLKTSLIELSVKRAKLTGLPMNQLGMMTAAFDHFYLPRLHREGFIAPNIKDLSISEHSAGGYVLEPNPGIYDNVIVTDFKSLYPSIIQTFKIDPLSRLLSHIETLSTPAGYRFSKTKNILPEFISFLLKQRASALKKGDVQLSVAIKILMNSFYGVMGSFGCRFYHPDLASAITSTGQALLLESKNFLEKKGYKVIYGDTDSLFIKLKKGDELNYKSTGQEIVNKLNEFWKQKLKKDYDLQSFLELEYEKYYRKFVITSARGSEIGAKKRYAGLVEENNEQKIEFVGLEFVRSDWTRLAKDFQTELYKRIFNELEIDNWIRDFVSRIKSGEFDNKLIYRKRLRKDTDEYTKMMPPHVKAAKLVEKTSGIIYYVITKRGPIPIELKHDDLDYEHYIQKQIKPIADSVLHFLGKSFKEIIQSGQLSFF